MIAWIVPLFVTIRWTDIVDILLVAVLIYQLYHIVKGTVAIKIFVGILSIYLLWKLFEALQMELLTEILGQFIGVGVIALIIVFQQELRRFLLMIGTTGFFRDKEGNSMWPWAKANQGRFSLDIATIVKACARLAESKTGVLLILTRVSDLQLYISSADRLDAELTQPLLESIFFKNSPLHDGAVIVSNNRIMAARCVLPISEREDFPMGLGTRHRAAVGITEISDSIAVIVSEETGNISYVSSGILDLDLTAEELEQRLRRDFA